MNVRIVALTVAVLLQASILRAADRITILTDAFARNPRLQQDWGYAALVEIGGRRILFDTGNDEAKFKRNVRALGVDLRRLDLVVISHRHGDHTAGLRFLRKVNPRVRIYAPADEHFGGPTPPVATLLKGATTNGKPVRLLAGGFHWVTTPLPENSASFFSPRVIKVKGKSFVCLG